ncbi:MAG: OadG family protein [Lachnospiraceae bacterium]|jgi:Na+-transporting methylmalonyl-CoA/oxaloacetate decarboxylase gamma subunit|nr:OadG family protein [Lachnospiraceae bacterium]
MKRFLQKRIIFIGALVCLGLFASGCTSTVDNVEYDAANEKAIVEYIINFCNTTDDATVEQIKSMSDFAIEQQLVSIGLPITPQNFLAILDSWKAGKDECGAYISHGDLVYSPSKTGLEISMAAQYENRDAQIVFILDEKLNIESMTVNANFTTAEILKKAGLNTVIGMGTVFTVLILISLLISLFGFIPAIQAKFEKAKSGKTGKAILAEESSDKNVAVPETQTAANPKDDLELIAVITAAIAAAQGGTTDGLVVRSIKKRSVSKWRAL